MAGIPEDADWGYVREPIYVPEQPKAKKGGVDPGYLLLTHFKRRWQEVHGYAYRGSDIRGKDASIMRAYSKRYGADAKPVMDFLFDKHRGHYAPPGERPRLQGIELFTSGSQWLCNMLRDEYHRSHEVIEAIEARGGSMASLSELFEEARRG